jgi:transcriptional regulator with XRE-family HTH domain
MDWPRNIKAFRLNSGMSSKEFAHRMGVSISTVSRWDSGELLFSKRAIENFSKIDGPRKSEADNLNTAPQVSAFRELVETSTSDAMLLDAELQVICASKSQIRWMFDTYGIDCVGVDWKRHMSPHTYSMLDAHGGIQRLVSNGLAHAESVYHLPEAANGNSLAHTKLVKHTVVRSHGHGILHLSCATSLPLGSLIAPPRINWLGA